MLSTAHGLLALTAAALLSAQIARAEGHAEMERSELAKAVGAANVSLERGMSASAREGKPLSAKFELDDSRLQLSVYVERHDRFREVIVDPQSAKVTKSEAIQEGEDLAAVEKQNAAMAKATKSLMEAVKAAVAANSGYQAVSATAMLSAGQPVAEVVLTKAGAWQTVKEKLD